MQNPVRAIGRRPSRRRKPRRNQQARLWNLNRVRRTELVFSKHEENLARREKKAESKLRLCDCLSYVAFYRITHFSTRNLTFD